VKLLLCLLLAGCATDSGLLKGSGIMVPPPAQWQIMCSDNPQLEICKPEVK
jgi:hypothetical protein